MRLLIFRIYLCFVFCILCLLGSSDVLAGERDFAFGINTSLNYFFEPDNELGDNSISIQFDYFANDRLHFTNQLELGINGLDSKYFVSGIRWVPFPFSTLLPYAAGQAIVQFDDRFDAGVRGSGGFMIDLTEAFGWYNVLAFYETNISILFREPASAFMDLFKIGILFAF
jgi:hypothetical protein